MTDHDAILEGLQQPELFSNAVMVPIEPNPPYKWIPMMLDPPEHGKWRHVLGLYFSPGRVSKLEDAQRAFAAELIEKFRGNGSCDFYTDFAAVFPTTIFLQIMGLPTDKLEDFMRWEDKILHATPESDPDRSMALNAMLEVMGYFSGLITQKREDPGPAATTSSATPSNGRSTARRRPITICCPACCCCSWRGWTLSPHSCHMRSTTWRLIPRTARNSWPILPKRPKPWRSWCVPMRSCRPLESPPRTWIFTVAPSRRATSSPSRSVWRTAIRTNSRAAAQLISMRRGRATSPLVPDRTAASVHTWPDRK
ncbi:putative cytochrome P450 [Mycobacterium xenopi 3993]|nr:putative cytochrome P450 [Mycobacterium xenopi 3993]